MKTDFEDYFKYIMNIIDLSIVFNFRGLHILKGHCTATILASYMYIGNFYEKLKSNNKKMFKYILMSNLRIVQSQYLFYYCVTRYLFQIDLKD